MIYYLTHLEMNNLCDICSQEEKRKREKREKKEENVGLKLIN